MHALAARKPDPKRRARMPIHGTPYFRRDAERDLRRASHSRVPRTDRSPREHAGRGICCEA